MLLNAKHLNEYLHSMGMHKTLYSEFLLFLFYRLSSVFVITTSYVPDEYWQSLEVAHNMVFGYGYLTWEWKLGLRSYIYPTFFAVFYKILELIYLDYAFILINLPKILQAILSALSDQYFLLSGRVFGFHDHWSKLVIFTNWFWYYCGSRTITNTFETSLTTIALYYYPWKLFNKNKKFSRLMQNEVNEKSVKYLSLAAINCIVRPTAITIWGPLVLIQLITIKSNHLKDFFFKCILPVLLIIIPTSFAIDFFFYGKFIIPAYKFFFFNIFQNISSFYGTHPFHWYLTQGLPVVLGLHFLPFVVGYIILFKNLLRAFDSPHNNIYRIWLYIVAINIIILSSVPHKEFRFILPLTPLMMFIVVKTLSEFFTPSRKHLKIFWTYFMTLAFILATFLFGVIHQRGTMMLMAYLRNSVVSCLPNCSFLFLMPCHSTPLYSHLHANISTKFLTCEPPIDVDVYDESENFFKKPVEWLTNYWDDKNPPSHVVFFDSLESIVGSYLNNKNFTKKIEFLHTIFTKKRSGSYILVYEAF